MAVLTIRNIDDSIKSDLRMQAARHGCSMEEEARRILGAALQGTQVNLPPAPFGTRLRESFTGIGEITLPPRRQAPGLAKLDTATARTKVVAKRK